MILRTAFLPACVMLVSVATSRGYELEPLGTLPELSGDWEILDNGGQGKIEARLPFRWVTFRHQKSGDLLSFATAPPETGKTRKLEFWSDTALEIFPNGRPVWTQEHTDATHTVLNIKAASLNKHEVLEYCFVTESSGRDNLMAHGCVWVCKAGIVFVQHTSAKPITPELVHDTLRDLIRSQP